MDKTAEIPKIKNPEYKLTVPTITDPVVKDTFESFQRQRQRPQQALRLENPQIKEGIYNLPGTEHHLLLSIGSPEGEMQMRGKSYHNVSFATAQVRRSSGELITEKVAIKPFAEARHAVHDARINAIVIERGFKTTEPLFVIQDEGKGYVLTRAKAKVYPLDALPWGDFHNGNEQEKSALRNHLFKVTQLLADLHYKGINHSDSQLRNFWLNGSEEVEAIDWESASVVSYPPDPDTLQNLTLSGLRNLFAWLAKPQENAQPLLIGGKSQQFEQFQKQVLAPYIERLADNLYQDGILDNTYLEYLTTADQALKRHLSIGQ